MQPGTTEYQLAVLRANLWGMAQIYDGNALREFWKIVRDVWEARQPLLLDKQVTLAEVESGNDD